jgi:hypothetical protein
MKIQILAICLFSLFSVACSNQWRDASGVTAEEMYAALGEVSAAQTSSTSGGDLNGALAMKDQPGVRIYFAQSKNQKDGKKNFIDPMGPVASIVSLTNLDFMGALGLSWSVLEEARIFFFDVPTEAGHTNGLILGVRKNGETSLTYAGFTGTGTMNEADLVVTLQAGGADKLVLRTFDVAGDDLENVIQMLVWDIDASGGEFYNGKFSTLIGFGD